MWQDTEATMSVVLEWAGLAPPAVEATMEALGADAEDTYAMYAYTTPEEIEQLMTTIIIADMPIGLGAKAKIRRAFKAIRFTLGVEEPAAVAAPPTPVILQAPAPAESKVDKVPLAGIIIQGGDVKVDMLSQAALDAAFALYRSECGTDPAHEKSPTDEQITAFEFIVNNRNNIYGDLAYLVPFAVRLIKAMRMHGARLQPDGAIVQVEIYGPPSIA